MIHHWLGWISLVICVFLLAKYVGRISKNQNLNRLLRKIHKPLGIIIIAAAGIHGLLCFIKSPQAVVQNITGLILFIFIAALAATFYAREKFKGKWFFIHKLLSLIFCVGMIGHILISV